jgi:hypothetical protein
VGLQEGAGGYLLPIRELRAGFMCADSRKGPWEWSMVWIMGILGLIIFSAGILFCFSALGFFPDRESGWSIGIPGIGGLLMGGWFIYEAIGWARSFTRLIIDGQNVLLENVFRDRTEPIVEGQLSADDHLMCRKGEDAEQDIYNVSTGLELVKFETSITLYLNGVSRVLKPKPGLDGLDEGFKVAVKQAFDKAKEIGDLLNIRVHY